MQTDNGGIYVGMETSLDEFNSAIKEAERRVKGFSDSTASHGEKINKTLSDISREAVKMSSSFQKETKRETGLIADLEAALVELRDKKRKAFSVEEIEKYNRKIQEAENDLREYNEAGKKVVETNKEQESTQGKIVESLKKWALGLLTISGAMKLFKEIVNSSNAASEEFQQTIDGVKGALQQMYQALIPSSEQTGNIVENMIKGFKGAKQLSEAINLYNESLKSNEVLESKELKRLKELEASWRNGANSIDQRKKDLDEWIRIKKDAAGRELKIEQDLNNALITEIQNRPSLAGANITRGDIEKFASIYATSPELMERAKDLYSQIRKFPNMKIASENGENWDEMIRMAKINASLTDEQLQALRDSFKRLYKAQSGEADVESDVARWMGSLTNKADKAVKEMNDLQNQIDELKKQLETAAVSERKAIAEKIILLEKELDLRKQIVAQTIDAVAYQGFVPTKVPTSLTPSVTPKVKPKQKTWEQQWIETHSLRPFGQKYWDERNKRELNDLKDIDAEEQKRIENALKLVSAMDNLTGILREQGVLTDDEAKQLSSMVNTVSSLIEHDYANAAMNLINIAASAFKKDYPGRVARAAEQLRLATNDITKNLNEIQRYLDQSDRKGGKKDALSEQGKVIQQQIDANNEAIKKYNKIVNGFWTSDKKRNEAKANIQELREENEKLEQGLQDSKQALADLLSGGITENTLADAIAQGFLDGRTSVDDFAEYMNNVLLDAVMNVFKASILGPAMTDLNQYITKSLEDKVLTPEEKAEIDRRTKQMADDNKKLWDDLTGALDLGVGPQSGLSGGIARQLTEDTGREITGLGRRMADDLRLMRDYNKLEVDQLFNIERNTFRTAAFLEQSNIKLDQIISNTKPGVSGSI